MTTLHIIVEIAEQIPTGRTEWRVDCAECGWYDIFDDRRRAEDAATRHVGDSHATENAYNRIVQTLRIEPNPEESDLVATDGDGG
ncbi:MAG: hypothetical protein J4G13_11465 [Dehalococcoidia bacterium]|nr:hypothetical protein [Dehalococcoidia bacterium]